MSANIIQHWNKFKNFLLNKNINQSISSNNSVYVDGSMQQIKSENSIYTNNKINQLSSENSNYVIQSINSNNSNYVDNLISNSSTYTDEAIISNKEWIDNNYLNLKTDKTINHQLNITGSISNYSVIPSSTQQCRIVFRDIENNRAIGCVYSTFNTNGSFITNLITSTGLNGGGQGNIHVGVDKNGNIFTHALLQQAIQTILILLILNGFVILLMQI